MTVWKNKGSAHKPKHTTSVVKHAGCTVMAWVCMEVSATDSLICIYYINLDDSSRKNSEVYTDILSASYREMYPPNVFIIQNSLRQ